MVYDTVHDLTWLLDANYAFTSGYAADNLNESNDSYAIHSDGKMGWDAANKFASSLVYSGLSDWRLSSSPGCVNKNAPCNTDNPWGVEIWQIFNQMYYGAPEIINGYIHYDFRNTSFVDEVTGLTHNFINTNFEYIENEDKYWTQVQFQTNSNEYWMYHNSGMAGLGNSQKSDLGFVWVVRDGDITKVPEPSSIFFPFLLAFGFLYNIRHKVSYSK